MVLAILQCIVVNHDREHECGTSIPQDMGPVWHDCRSLWGGALISHGGRERVTLLFRRKRFWCSAERTPDRMVIKQEQRHRTG